MRVESALPNSPHSNGGSFSEGEKLDSDARLWTHAELFQFQFAYFACYIGRGHTINQSAAASFRYSGSER
jgi:hypothetical protein